MARAYDSIKKGLQEAIAYPIETEWTRDVTSEGHLHRVARYELVGEKPQRDLFDNLEAVA